MIIITIRTTWCWLPFHICRELSKTMIPLDIYSNPEMHWGCEQSHLADEELEMRELMWGPKITRLEGDQARSQSWQVHGSCGFHVASPTHNQALWSPKALSIHSFDRWMNGSPSCKTRNSVKISLGLSLHTKAKRILWKLSLDYVMTLPLWPRFLPLSLFFPSPSVAS